jgi:hypothetical protein
MSFLTQNRGSRGSVLLVAFLLSLAPASRAMGDMPTTPGKLGAMTPSLCLLVAGSWFAFKEGGWFSKAFAAGVLALFGYGVSTGLDHARSSQEVDSELAQIRTDVAKDVAKGDVSTDAAKRRLDNASAAAERMKTSDNSETAEFGQALEVVNSVCREMSQGLMDSLEPIQAPGRFMQVAAMIERDDFEWQHKTVNDYLTAAKSAAIANESIADTVSARLLKSGVDAGHAREVVKGVERMQPLNARALQAHIRFALACAKMIDFVELHRAEITPRADGKVIFTKQDQLDVYSSMRSDLTASQKALESANKQLMQMMKTIGG